MIEFKVTGETWKEIQKNLEGLFNKERMPDSVDLEPVVEPSTVIETVETPPDEFTPEWKEPDSPLEAILPQPLPSPPGAIANLDSGRNPYNPEIHTRTKATNDDGTWKLKRRSPKLPAPSKVVTPPAIPDFTATQIDDLGKLATYVVKINTEKNLTEHIVPNFLKSIRIPNIIQVPKEKLPEVAEKLKSNFGVEY